MFSGQPVRQIAYFVPDVREAARRHSAQFGSGPYFVNDSMVLGDPVYRGTPLDLDHSAALGQWGDVMIEFSQQNQPGPSYFHDIYPEGSGRFGLHHVALIVDDFGAAKRHFSGKGYATAFEAIAVGVPFAMMDATADYGHMIELYPKCPIVDGLYDMVRDAAADFDGSDVIRPMPSA